MDRVLAACEEYLAQQRANMWAGCGIVRSEEVQGVRIGPDCTIQLVLVLQDAWVLAQRLHFKVVQDAAQDRKCRQNLLVPGCQCRVDKVDRLSLHSRDQSSSKVCA